MEQQRLDKLVQLAGLAVEQIQMRMKDSCSDQGMLHRGQGDSRILVDITNAVLSKLHLNELMNEIISKIHFHFDIDVVSVVLRSSRQKRLTVYTSHLNAQRVPRQEKLDVPEAGTLSERVLNNGEMLLLKLSQHDKVLPYERALQESYKDVPVSLCLLPLKFGDKLRGVLKLAKRGSQGFTPSALALLRQVAGRIAIAVDNALAWQALNASGTGSVYETRSSTERVLNPSVHSNDLIYQSETMAAVIRQVNMVADSDCSVLILGETGTGKELIARAIHNLSQRKHRRMVKMNCAAMPAGLLESDLFGHERGAFTGASAQRIGRFELADQSTLFLDEVGDMPLELQPKLLRVIQEQEFERLGSNKVQSVNVRLISATNCNLKRMVAEGTFRRDLYYRLNVFPLYLPPLRERQEDIPLLVKFFTFKIAQRLKRNIDSIPAETLRTLSRMEWAGNIRELENVIERAVLLTQGSVLNVPFSELDFQTPDNQLAASPPPQEYAPDEDECSRIIRVLKETNGVIAGPRGAARRLGIKRTTLISRMKRLGIDKNTL